MKNIYKKKSTIFFTNENRGENVSKKNSEEIGEIKSLTTLKINTQFFNNSKMFRMLGRETNLQSSSKEIQINEKIVNLLDIQSNEKISLSDRITPFDMAVMDAVYTIICSGQKVVVLEWISKILSGNMQEKDSSEKKEEEIRKSIEKLKNIECTIDCTEEFNEYRRQRKKKPLSNWTFKGSLLPLVEEVEVSYQSNGKKVVAYPIYVIPAIYRYAKANNQIISVPNEYFLTNGKMNNTTESIIIKRYVIKRIAQMIKCKNMNSNRLSFLWLDNNSADEKERGLYPELGYVPDDSNTWNKKTKPKIKKIVESTLGCLKEKNIISNYKPYKEKGSKSVIGFQIFFSENTKDF